MVLSESITLLRALNDPTRIRLLALLEGEEMTVAELQRVLDVPQSRVSTHLARLKEAGLAADRVDGTHRYYRLANGLMAPPVHAAWQAVRESLAQDQQLERDRHRRDEVAATRGADWVDRVAGSLDRHYSPGRTWESLARGLALLPDLGGVVDLGAGDGAIAELLGPRAHWIIGVDNNPRMVEAAGVRLKRAKVKNVKILEADMHKVPLASASADFVLLLQSLQYAERPPQVLREAGRMLKPNCRVLIVTLAAHQHPEVRSAYGHLHLGFRPAQLRAWMAAASLETVHLASAGRERRPPQFEALEVLGRKRA